AAPRTAAAAPHRGPVAIFASREPGAGRELGVVSVRGGFNSDVRELFPELVHKVQELGGNTLVIDAMGAHFQQGGPGAGFSLNGAVYTCPYGCRRSTVNAPTEAVTVELKGRALWLSQEELERAEGGTP
ncbi:MAG TPA: hypothetical protein VFS00_01775, partial [Polyangiaceae bacterium]|nr:hypothetical protein [Polyangiaceae bacterium]